MAALKQKINLFKGLLTGHIAYNAPFFVTVDVTNRCNLKCLCCRFHSPAMGLPSENDTGVRDIPFHVFESLCKDLKTIGTAQVLLCGEGEPFLHPRIFDLISVAKNAGLQVVMFTNGTFLDKARVMRLIEARLDILRVSLWAGSQEIYKKNYPSDNVDNFNKVVEGLKYLSDLKKTKTSKFPYVILCHPVNSHNLHNIDDVVNLACSTGCNTISFSFKVSPFEKLSKFSLSIEEEKLLLASLRRAKTRLKTYSVSHNYKQIQTRLRIGKAVWEKLPCYVGRFHAIVKMDGAVFPCCRCNIQMGNLTEKTFPQIWNDKPFLKFRKDTSTRKGLSGISECCNCNFCLYVEDNVRVHRLFKWFQPFRIIAKKRQM